MRVSTYEPGRRPPIFWAMCGPFFADQRIRKEMPYLRDDPERYFWCAADGGDGDEAEWHGARGIGSAHTDPPKGDITVGFLHGLYVRAEHRREGVASALVKQRIEWLHAKGATIIRATATPMGALVLGRCGFVEVGIRGSYIKMQLRSGL